MEVLALPANSPSTITSGGQDSAAAARNAHVICAESAKRLSLSPLSHRVGTAGSISACDFQVVKFEAGLFCRSKGLVCQSRAKTQSSRPISEPVTPSHDESRAHRNAAKHAAAEAIENIVWPHGPALIRLYFRYVHLTLPIISKFRFLWQYATDKDAVSASLRGAVYALACVF
jgi:hypothetical protein